MINDQIARYMVYSLDPEPGDDVVEIGAGLGALTRHLSKALYEPDSHIYAIDIDARFTSKLEAMFGSSLNVRVVEADILEWLPDKEFVGDFKVLGSLPYYITSPILHMLVKLHRRPTKSVLLIQKEVGEKIAAQSPDASYLSVFLQTFFEVTYLKTVSREIFKPTPKVDGAIVSLDRVDVEEPFDNQENIELYEKFLHRGFSFPRKMLNKVFSKKELEVIDLNPTLRPQAVPVDSWKEVFIKLTDKK